MSSYFITGCSKGLGLEFVRQLLAKPKSQVGIVIATSRNPSNSTDLTDLVKSSEGRLHYIQLDVLDQKSIDAAFSEASKILGDKGLDVLINNAGITKFEPGGIAKMAALQSLLETNVLAVHQVSAAALPLLEKGKDKKIVNMSTTFGSIALAPSIKMVPTPSYKISKAALNALTVQYATDLEEKGFTVFCVSPGWLQTDLGGEIAHLTVDVGAKATLDIILNSTKKDNGVFRNIKIESDDPNLQLYDGKNAPW